MKNSIIGIIKLLVLALYISPVVTLYIPALIQYQTMLSYIVLALTVAHIGEFLFFQSKLAKLPGSQAKHFVQTLLFGFVYWLPLFKAKQTS
ncbi:hypothetical protein RGQ13_09350 [Thalassotalea psychrophila]|uniref:DUF1145 domain-containing protein n=1 Tax=Thalassotalea psychrophila TaxID=3065647 RepID=A0ABY9U006_9GAMM|nr:hypothetical protein RGQ13_09350 [Colwelliaceae bacterium SQ149]